jgi:hypothetical protein
LQELARASWLSRAGVGLKRKSFEAQTTREGQIPCRISCVNPEIKPLRAGSRFAPLRESGQWPGAEGAGLRPSRGAAASRETDRLAQAGSKGVKISISSWKSDDPAQEGSSAQ